MSLGSYLYRFFLRRNEDVLVADRAISYISLVFLFHFAFTSLFLVQSHSATRLGLAHRWSTQFLIKGKRYMGKGYCSVDYGFP
jgi:hypothetical protein